MKKKITRLLYTFFAIFAIIACTKEIEIEDNFNFDFNVIKQDNAIINENNPWYIYISPEREVSTIDYYFSYEILEGSGSFETPPSALGAINIIDEGEESLITCLDCFYFNYKGTTPGLHKVRVFIRNTKGLVVSHDYEIMISYQPFVFNFALGTANFYINTPLDVSTTLLNGSSAGTELYSFIYTVAGGTGLLSKNGTALATSSSHVFNSGDTDLTYLPTTTGQHIITAKATAQDGNEITRILTIDVTNVPFSFTAVPTTTNIYINESTPITYNLMQLNVNGSPLTGQYTFVYNGSNGNGILSYPNGNVITPGSPYSVNSGTWAFNYVPTTLGTHSLSFTVTDNSFVPQSVTVNLDLNAAHVPVTFNAASLPSTYVNQSVPVNYVVTPQVATIASYEMNYVLLQGQGVLSNGSSSVAPGTYFTVSTGNFSYSYTPTIPGTHVLQFFLKDSNGQIITKDVTIQATTNSFTFLPTAASTVYVNQNNLFNFALVPSGIVAPGTTYTMTYSVVSGSIGTFNNGTNTFNQGIPISVSPNSFQLNYNPITVGAHTINYSIIDSNGTIVTYQQIINVVASDFSFIAQQSNNTIFKNNDDLVVLSISSSIGGPTITYTLTYNIVGVGGLFYSNGSPVPSGTIITPGNHNVYFRSNSAGNATINFTITDSNGTIRTDSVAYNVQNVGFSLSTSGDGSLILNNTKDFYAYLSQSAPDASTTYQVRFIVGSGSMGSGEVRSNGNLLSLGTYYPISIGSTVYQFKGTSSGNVNLIVEVKDTYNVTNSSTVVFNVSGIGYTFTGAADDTTLYIGETTPLNFDITESAPSGTNYEMKYVFTQGNGTVLNGSSSMSSGVWYPVNIGAFSRSFTSTEAGQAKVLFTSRNAVTLVEHTQLITINSSTSGFTFTANNVTNDQTIGTSIPINFLLNQLGTAPTTYTMTFTTTGTGTFIYNGNSYTTGQPISVVPGSFSGTYIGTTVGTHDLEFEVTNSNLPPVVVSDDFELNFLSPDFIMSTSGDGSLIINSEKDFNVFLAQVTNAPAINYQVRYSYASGTTGTGEIKTNSGTVYSLGQLYPITLGNTTMKYKALTVGTVKLKVEIIDSNNVNHSSIILFDNDAFDYLFSGTQSNNNIIISQNTQLTFDLTETSPSGTNYEMKHEFISGNANIINSGNISTPGIWESVSVGQFSRTFNSTQNGLIKVLFTVRNTTTLVEKTKLFQINVSGTDFTLSTTGDGSLYVSENLDFNTILTQVSPDPITTYQMKYSFISGTVGDGEIRYNGNLYTENQYYTTTIGTSTLNFKATAAGLVKVKIDVIDSNGINHNSIVQFNVLANSFDLVSLSSIVNPFTTTNGIQVSTPGVTFKIFNESIPTDTYEIKYEIINMNYVQDPDNTNTTFEISTRANVFNSSTHVNLFNENTFYSITNSVINNPNNKLVDLFFTGLKYSTFSIKFTIKNSSNFTRVATLNFIGDDNVQNADLMYCFQKNSNFSNGNSTYRIKYYNTHTYNGQLPTNVKIYGRKDGSTNDILWYSGQPSSTPFISPVYPLEDFYRGKIIFTYPDGTQLIHDRGLNYTCANTFGISCVNCL